MKVLNIILNKELKGHKDIKLEIQSGDFIKISDSYWFHSLPDYENFTVFELFALNLKVLKDHIGQMKIGETFFFPFELNDQSAGFICFKKVSKNGKINIYYVQSITKVGSEISPMFSPEFNLHFDDYFMIEFGGLCELNDLISDLERIIASILSAA